VRFLADENLPHDVLTALREQGHDGIWVAEAAPGMRDRDVLAMAVREERVFLTMDKDFGELAFAQGLPAACGVILFRIPTGPPGEMV